MANKKRKNPKRRWIPVSYTHLRAHETRHDLVCRLLLEKKKGNWSNTEGFIKKEGININLASSKANYEVVNKSISISTKTSKLNLKENLTRSKFINEEEPIQAPFLGTKVLYDFDIDLSKLIFYLDKKLYLADNGK